jgi:hypothetical protein
MVISEGGVTLMRVQNNELLLQTAAPNEDVQNLVWYRIKKIVQRFIDSDLFRSIIEALGVPAA